VVVVSESTGDGEAPRSTISTSGATGPPASTNAASPFDVADEVRVDSQPDSCAVEDRARDAIAHAFVRYGRPRRLAVALCLFLAPPAVASAAPLAYDAPPAATR
jgi:hypothetical protein